MPLPVLSEDHAAILRAIVRTSDQSPLVLEEIAAIATVSFEQAWYVVGDLIEVRLMTAAGLGAYHLTVQGKEAANQLRKAWELAH